MEQHIERATDESIDQVELLGQLVAQEFENVVEEMFALMLSGSDEDSPQDEAAPRTRAAGK